MQTSLSVSDIIIKTSWVSKINKFYLYDFKMFGFLYHRAVTVTDCRFTDCSFESKLAQFDFFNPHVPIHSAAKMATPSAECNTAKSTFSTQPFNLKYYFCKAKDFTCVYSTLTSSLTW